MQIVNEVVKWSCVVSGITGAIVAAAIFFSWLIIEILSIAIGMTG